VLVLKDVNNKRRIRMPFRVSGKNIDIGEALRQRIGARIDEAAEKYFDGGGFSGHATVNKDGFGFRTECEVHLDSGAVLEAKGMDADAYLSADKAAVRIEKQLRRYSRKLKDRSGGQVRRKLKAMAEFS
jgi:ribosomal subunit interface protein